MTCSIVIIGNDEAKRIPDAALADSRITGKALGCNICENGKVVTVVADPTPPSGFIVSRSTARPPKPAETYVLKFANSSDADAWVDAYPGALAYKTVLQFDPDV